METWSCEIASNGVNLVFSCSGTRQEFRFSLQKPGCRKSWRLPLHLKSTPFEIAPLETVPDQDTRVPASDFMLSDGVGRIGIIASVSRRFCMSCNRTRLTADGKLRNCLFALDVH